MNPKMDPHGKVDFDAAVVSATAVQKAAYVFIQLATFDIQVSDGDVVCHYVFKDHASEEARASFEPIFREEVLDYSLREKIAHETEELRTLILGYAFSKTGLQSE